MDNTSAGGSVKEGRDRNTQGCYSIRGKMPNAFRTSRAKMFENAEVQGFIKCLLNGPYRKDFDPYKDVPWEKVVIMADKYRCPKMLFAKPCGLFIRIANGKS